jgi:hypothetical protein
MPCHSMSYPASPAALRLNADLDLEAISPCFSEE